MPGALMLQWIFDIIMANYEGWRITYIRSTKFLDACRPGDECDVQIAFDESSKRMKINCVKNNVDAVLADISLEMRDQ